MNAKIDISNVILKTDRLVLRSWKKEDLNDLFFYASKEDVGIRAGWLPHKDIKESEQILDIFIKSKSTLAIVYNNKVIGSLGIDEYDEDKLPEFKDIKAREIGFVIDKPYWGKGIMKEAVEAVKDYLFNEVKLDVIVCGHYLENAQSKRVQEKCGFKLYKEYETTTRYGAIKHNCCNIIKKQ